MGRVEDGGGRPEGVERAEGGGEEVGGGGGSGNDEGSDGEGGDDKGRVEGAATAPPLPRCYAVHLGRIQAALAWLVANNPLYAEVRLVQPAPEEAHALAAEEQAATAVGEDHLRR